MRRLVQNRETNLATRVALSLVLFGGSASVVAACGAKSVPTYGPNVADAAGKKQFAAEVHGAKLGSSLRETGLYGSQRQGLEVKPGKAKIAQPALEACINGFSETNAPVVAPTKVVAEGVAVISSVGQALETMQSVQDQSAALLIIQNGPVGNQLKSPTAYDVFVCTIGAKAVAISYAQLPGFQPQAEVPKS